MPPFKRLTKAQLSKLNNAQRKAYLEELDYREKMFYRKQLKEERMRRKLMKKMAAEASTQQIISTTATLKMILILQPMLQFLCPIWYCPHLLIQTILVIAIVFWIHQVNGLSDLYWKPRVGTMMLVRDLMLKDCLLSKGKFLCPYLGN